MAVMLKKLSGCGKTFRGLLYPWISNVLMS